MELSPAYSSVLQSVLIYLSPFIANILFLSTLHEEPLRLRNLEYIDDCNSPYRGNFGLHARCLAEVHLLNRLLFWDQDEYLPLRRLVRRKSACNTQKVTFAWVKSQTFHC